MNLKSFIIFQINVDTDKTITRGVHVDTRAGGSLKSLHRRIEQIN